MPALGIQYLLLMSLIAEYKSLRLGILSVVALLILLTGCKPRTGREIPEENVAAFKTGREYIDQGKHDQAISSFLKVIEANPRSPESHIELGQLYLQYANDPVLAIYHFRQYLKYKPTSREAPMVRELINTAKKEFARTFPAGIFDRELEQLDKIDVIKQKNAEILELKKELARERAANSKLEAQVQELKNREPQETTVEPIQLIQARVQPLRREGSLEREHNSRGTFVYYTVVTGDTLTRISEKVYGSRARWKEIYDANTDVMANPNSLKVGMKLKIP